MAIKCDFDYCIYNKKYKCTLDEINVNAFGMCEDCVLVHLDEKLLEKQKQAQKTSRRWLVRL